MNNGKINAKTVTFIIAARVTLLNLAARQKSRTHQSKMMTD